MSLGNFYEIMESIIGPAQNDIQVTILYFISAILGMMFIFMVFHLFALAGRFLSAR